MMISKERLAMLAASITGFVLLFVGAVNVVVYKYTALSVFEYAIVIIGSFAGLLRISEGVLTTGSINFKHKFRKIRLVELMLYFVLVVLSIINFIFYCNVAYGSSNCTYSFLILILVTVVVLFDIFTTKTYKRYK